MMGPKINACALLMRKPERKRPLGKRRRTWADNIKMDLKEINWVMWTGLIWPVEVISGGLL
jgi:hypothetical protein